MTSGSPQGVTQKSSLNKGRVFSVLFATGQELRLGKGKLQGKWLLQK